MKVLLKTVCTLQPAIAAIWLTLGLAAASDAIAAPANSFAVGIFDTPGTSRSCLNSAAPGVISTDSTDCDAGGGNAQAAMASFDSNGQWGSYVTLAGPSSIRFGANGADRMVITGSGITALTGLSMSSHQITNLAAGTGDTDAVNVSQLKGIASALGGGAAVQSDGTIAAPSYALTNANSIAGTTGAAADAGSGFDKVDAALGALNTSVTDNATSIDNINSRISNGTIGLVQQAAAGADLTVGKDTGGVAVDFADKNGNTRTLKNVTAGTLSANSLEAVNGSQLYATNQQVTLNATAINDLNTQINNGMIGLVQQDPTTRAITVARNTNGATIDMTGTQGPRTVTGVANGDVSATSVQAVNGSQLHATNQQVAQNTADISNLNTSVAQNTTDIVNLNSNVAQNTANIARNTSDITNINNAISSGNVGLVRQDAASRNITIAKDNDGAVVDVTGTQGTRTVTGVSAGALAADSTDAVNGSQLFETNQNITDLSQRVVNFESNGSAVVAASRPQRAAAASGDNSVAIGDGADAVANNSVALGSRSVADEDNTVSIGSAGSERRITNVAPGVKGTDAVNMNQLNALQNNVNTVAREAFAGVAAAMAMPNLTPSRPGGTVVAAGVANYKGYSAVGVGGTYRSMNNRWLVNGAASFTPHGDTGVRGQVGYEF